MKQYSMTSPIAEHVFSAFIKEGAVKLESENDLNGLKTGFFTGAITEQFTRAVYPYLLFESVDINTTQEAAEKLASGEIDAFVLDAAFMFSFSASCFQIFSAFPLSRMYTTGTH